MIYQVIEWVYYFCCMVCMIWVGEWTFHWMIRSRKNFVIAGIIYIISFVFLQIQGNSFFPFFMLFCMGEILALSFLGKGKFKNRLIKSLLIFLGVRAVEAGFMLLLESLLQDIVVEELLRLVAILMSMVCLAIITRRKWYRRLVRYMQSLPRKVAILILCVVVNGLLIVGYGNMVGNLVDAKGAFMLYQILFITELIMVIGIAIWLILVSNQTKYYLEQKALKEEVLHTRQECYKSICEKNKEVLNFRQNVFQQLVILKSVLKRGDLEGTKLQLESIKVEFEKVALLQIHVGDEMLDSILSMMNQEAEKKHIQLEMKGRIESERCYDSYELCIIFSNAISNAIGACEKLESSGPIRVNILEEKKVLLCTVENPATEGMYQQIQQRGVSGDNLKNPGYGVGKIERAVKRLNGEMRYIYQAGKITLEIYI